MNKLSLEQNLAPLRNTNFSLNGNNDLIDTVELTKLLSFNNTSSSSNSTNSSNSNTNNNINSNLINNNLNNNISNKK